MVEIKFKSGEITASEQDVISAGFARHTKEQTAPPYDKQRINWLVYNEPEILVGALTADLVWDWIYIDELWVDESCRGTGLGKKLMQQVEDYATKEQLSGLWLWTQSWQAAEFYESLGYEEFTRFEDFPKGHFRVGLSKRLVVT